MAEVGESVSSEDSESMDKNNHLDLDPHESKSLSGNHGNNSFSSSGEHDVKVMIENHSSNSHDESGIERDLKINSSKNSTEESHSSSNYEGSNHDALEDVHQDIEMEDNNHLGLGLKKDDSGIDLGRSPTSGKDNSLLSDIDISESQTDSGAGSRTNSVSEASVSNKDTSKNVIKDNTCASSAANNGNSGVNDSREKGGNSSVMPECVDTEDSDPIGSYNVTMLPSDTETEEEEEVKGQGKDAMDCDEESKKRKLAKAAKLKESIRKQRRVRKFYHLPLDSDDTESDVDDHLQAAEGEGQTRRSQGQIETLDSDDDNDNNSSDNSDDDDVVKEKKDSDDNESEEESSETGAKPKQTWRALFDCRNREYGYTNRTPPALFREKVQGSLQMVQRFKLQYKMDYHEGCVNALHFNRIGTLLASGSDDLNVVLWNWIRNRPALVYDSGHRSNVFQAKFMPFSGDCHVVSCARDGQIRLAELSLTGVCKGTKKLAQHRGAAHKLALELDSPHVFLSCGEDAVVFEVDLRQDKPNKLVLTKEGEKKIPLYSIHSNPANSVEFCVGGRDHFIRVYDKRKIDSNDNHGILKRYCPHHLMRRRLYDNCKYMNERFRILRNSRRVNSDVKANVTCAVYNYNGTEILGSYNDEDIFLFSNDHSDGAEHIHRYRGHRNNATVKGVNFYGPKSEFVVSGSDCGHVFLWDRETEDIVQFMEGDDGGVINVLEPHPFAPVLATSGLDHDVKIWAPTAEEPTNLKEMRKTVKKNKKERDEERVNEPDMIDGQMLWYIMHHIRRARRRAQQDGEGAAEREDNSSSSDASEYDSEDSEDMPERMSCTPS